MSKQAIVFGLLVALLAVPVTGISDASAVSVPYYGPLYCSPATQSVANGEYVSFTAYSDYVTNVWPQRQLTWTAVGGNPSYGYGTTFGTRFYTSSISETRIVSVTDGYQTATCTVYVSGVYPTPTWTPIPTWTPTPTPYQYLQCSPSYTSVNSGDLVSLYAWGGDGSYSWSASEGTPSYGYGTNFSTRFYNYQSYAQHRIVTVTSAGQSAVCTVLVNGSYVTPTPTPYYGNVSVDHTLRNMTRGGEGNSVTAYNGDRLQFIVRITTGNQYADDVHIRDWLPQYVTYVPGTTTLDGNWYMDGITTGNENSSLALGMLSPNRTYVVRFEGTLNGAPTMWLTNTVNVHVRGFVDQSRTSTISVVGSSYTPTPTVSPYPNARTEVRYLGRNVTRGQTGEYTSLRARGGDTLDLIIRIRSTNNAYLYNAYVTDLLPSGLVYITRSTTLNGREVGDGITSSGINVGTLVPNSDTVVKFSVRVDSAFVPSWGVVTMNSTAQVRADGLGTVSVQLPITVGQNINLATAATYKTGPADSLWLALLISALVTGVYAAYTRSDVFGRRMVTAEIGRLSKTSGPNFLK